MKENLSFRALNISFARYILFIVIIIIIIIIIIINIIIIIIIIITINIIKRHTCLEVVCFSSRATILFYYNGKDILIRYYDGKVIFKKMLSTEKIF